MSAAPARHPLVDKATGLITPEWLRWLSDLGTVGAASAVSVLQLVQAAAAPAPPTTEAGGTPPSGAIAYADLPPGAGVWDGSPTISGVLSAGVLSAIDIVLPAALFVPVGETNAYRFVKVGADLGSFGTYGYMPADGLNKRLELYANNTTANGAAAIALTVSGNNGTSSALTVAASTANVKTLSWNGGAASFASTIAEKGRTTPMGVWIPVTFSAANFTGDTGTWGVDSADQVAFEYMLIGDTMFVNFDIRSTDVGAVAPSVLQITIPGGFTVAKGTRGTYFYSDAGGATTVGTCVVTTTGTVIQCFKAAGAGAWTVTAGDNTSVLGQIWFRVNT
jgi:hypothetical protein